MFLWLGMFLRFLSLLLFFSFCLFLHSCWQADTERNNWKQSYWATCTAGRVCQATKLRGQRGGGEMAQVLLDLDFQEWENYLNCQTGLPCWRHVNATFSTLHHGDRRSSNLRLCMHVIRDSNLMALDMLISVHHVLAAICVEGFTFSILSSSF